MSLDEIVTNATIKSITPITTEEELTDYTEHDFLVVSPSITSTTRGLYNNKVKGECVFDETIGKSVWWNGTGWVDATGVPADNSLKVLAITQSAYDALATKDPNTLYIIS